MSLNKLYCCRVLFSVEIRTTKKVKLNNIQEENQKQEMLLKKSSSRTVCCYL